MCRSFGLNRRPKMALPSKNCHANITDVVHHKKTEVKNHKYFVNNPEIFLFLYAIIIPPSTLGSLKQVRRSRLHDF